MSKTLPAVDFRATFISYGMACMTAALLKEHQRDMQAALMRASAAMDDVAKSAHDLALVRNIEKKHGVASKPMEKQSKYSGRTFEHGTAACKALHRARRVLAPTTKAEAEELIAKFATLVSFSKDPVAKAVSLRRQAVAASAALSATQMRKVLAIEAQAVAA